MFMTVYERHDDVKKALAKEMSQEKVTFLLRITFVISYNLTIYTYKSLKNKRMKENERKCAVNPLTFIYSAPFLAFLTSSYKVF